MDSILIVSSSKKGTTFFTEMLSQNSYGEIVYVTNGGEVRRFLLERDLYLCLINAPLIDESGDGVANSVVANGIGQAMLDVRSEL